MFFRLLSRSHNKEKQLLCGRVIQYVLWLRALLVRLLLWCEHRFFQEMEQFSQAWNQPCNNCDAGESSSPLRAVTLYRMLRGDKKKRGGETKIENGVLTVQNPAKLDRRAPFSLEANRESTKLVKKHSVLYYLNWFYQGLIWPLIVTTDKAVSRQPLTLDLKQHYVEFGIFGATYSFFCAKPQKSCSLETLFFSITKTTGMQDVIYM